MKICIVGAGAIGGLLAVKYALAGNDVTVIDQGPHLEAIQENGLKLIWEDGSEHVARVRAVATCDQAGPHDMVVLALKAHYLEQVARDIDELMKDETFIVTVQNGIPWWYFHRHGGPFDGRRLDMLDPNNVLGRFIDAERIVGCVVYPAAGAIAPGVVQHVEGDRFPIGELDGRTDTPRLKTLQALFEDAGFRSRVLEDIRSEIWLKAWGNLSFNPISALTHATLEDICRFPETRDLSREMMREAQIIAEKIGVTFRHTIEKRIAGAESVGRHKTSMLQDVEAGRSLETEALIGAILEIGEWTGTPAPAIRSIYALVKLLNRTMVVEGGGVRLNPMIAA